MDEQDLRVRNHVYGRFIELGRAPRLEEITADLGLTQDEAEAALRRLHDAHALVLERGASELRMANPFSAVATAYRVDASGRKWFANCAWDAFGIPAALGVDGRISCVCPDCGEPIEIDVRDERPVADEHVAHLLVPASHWWDDIVFT